MPKIVKKFVTDNINEKYFSIVNNIDDIYSHQKINDGNSDTVKSGILSKAPGKIIRELNSLSGTLPSVLKTTGNKVQSFNDPFNETNLLKFTNKVSSSSIGFPLINVTEEIEGIDVNVGHYITTDDSLITQGTISKTNDDFYVSKYDLSNTKIFDNPNTFDNLISSERKITPENFENIFKQERFEEKYEPYIEDFISTESLEENDFYNKTIDKDIVENYKLGNQKQIKIIIDFSNQDVVDLSLLNTKLTFNNPQPEYIDTFTSDELVSTRYFNFLDNVAESYSSHFLPTAYWNFKNERWNYLDGNLLEFSQESLNNLNPADFSVINNSEIKYSALGAKNNNGKSLSISRNFIYNNNVIDSQSIYEENLKNNILSVYNKPILTSPGYRPDGSFLSTNISEDFNKTAIGKITNSYGFPYKQNWQPNRDHLLDMSQYISGEFLLEKMSIKGSFTSRGEMPVKKGNFSSGYRQSNVDLNEVSFNEVYDYKDDYSDYIANNLTFFILNERKGINHVKNNILEEPLQSYFFSKDLGDINYTNNYYNVSGKSFDSYLGEYSSYESYQDTLKVYSQIIPSGYIYNNDKYNNVELKSSYSITSNNIEVKPNVSENVFHFLENSNINSNNTTIDSIYVKKDLDWTSDYDTDVLDNLSNKVYNIKLENFNGSETSMFDFESSRELITYSNFLITGKKVNAEFDQNVLKNIDGDYTLDFEANEKVNINILQKQDFIVNSFVKNTFKSDYLDESINKIKSNLKEEVLVSDETNSKILLGIDDDIENYFKTGNPLFEFRNDGSDGDYLEKILGAPVSSFDSLTSYHGVNGGSNLIGNDLSTCIYPHAFFDFTVKLNDSLINSRFVINYVYFNPAGEKTRNANSIPGTINLQEYIIHQKGEDSNGSLTNIFLNTRFLHPFNSAGNNESFKNFGLTHGSFTRNAFYDYVKFANLNVNFKITSNNIDVWDSLDFRQKSNKFLKFLFLGLYTAPIYDRSNGNDTGEKLYEFLNFDIENGFVKFDNQNSLVEINFFESAFNPYNNLNDNDISFSNIDSNGIFRDIALMENNFRGSPEVKADEFYYNYNNVLEGKTAGQPNNLGISSERVVDYQNIGNKLQSSINSISGKIFKEENDLDVIKRSTYLLKPTDKIVFGVTSNSNGEVMPSIVTLHDKLEITLIGRDYIKEEKHKTNESISIRKTIIGDSDVNSVGHSIYQTEGSYYDNVWNNNLNDEFNNKKVIGRLSSKEFGSYTGFLTLNNSKNTNNETLYIADSVHPSLSNVYLNCLNKEVLYSVDSQDRYNYKYKKSGPINKVPSYKLIFSDIINLENIQNYPNRYSKVVTNWHKTFHLQEHKDFFQSNRNKKIIDSSYDVILNNKRDFNSRYFVYYDTHSYSAGLNYEDLGSMIQKSLENGDQTAVTAVLDGSATQSLQRHYKSIKTYLLPFSKNYLIQNAVEINENSITNKARYIENNILLEKNLSNKRIFEFSRYSLQYITHDIFPEYCDVSDDIVLTMFGLEYKNETGVIGFTSGWCMVVEPSEVVFNSIIDEIDFGKDIFESDIVENLFGEGNSQYKITYYNKDIFLNISKKPQSYNDYSDIDTSYTVTKKFRLIKKEFVVSSEGESEFYLISPLHFWETNEINVTDTVSGIFRREQDSLQINEITGYGRKNNKYNISNKASIPETAWYAVLNDDNNIGDTNNNTRIYEPFLILDENEEWDQPDVYPTSDLNRKINITGLTTTSTMSIAATVSAETLFLPYTYSDLSLTSEGQNAAIERTLLISLSQNKILESNTNAHKNISTSIQKLNNNHIIENTKLHCISESLLDNDFSLINQKRELALFNSVNEDKDLSINEKVYVSKFKKVINNHELNTNTSLIYKVKKLYIENNANQNQEDYNIVDVIGLYNNFTIFKKNKLVEDELVFDISNTNIVKLYENSIDKNKNRFLLTNDKKVPCFEIDFTTKLTGISSLVYQIPYAHYTLDASFSPPAVPNEALNIKINDISEDQAYDLSSINTSSGSPIFKLEEYPEGYVNKIQQEEKIKLFLYGFSREKSRYPISRLDGFKYGVENGSKIGFSYYFKTDSFGQFSDKIMGSTEFATAKLNKNGDTVFDWPIHKRFTNEYFQYVESNLYDQNINRQTFNSDEHSRSYYPFIEDATNNLSQLNSENIYYDESYVF